MFSMKSTLLVLLCWLPFTLSEPLVGQELETLSRQLADADKWERKKALEGLAKLGGGEAWQLVLGALRDPMGEVADTAEWYLGQCDEDPVIAALQGKQGLSSRDAWVRLRAAGVLARIDGVVDGELLLRLLKEKDPAWACAGLHAIESKGRSEQLGGDLEKKILPVIAKVSVKARDGSVRAAALRAWRVLDPEGSAGAIQAAQTGRIVPARAAAMGLGASLETLVSALADDDVAVRVAAIEALARLESVPACVALVEGLASESSLRLQWRIVERLQALSGLAHRRDPRPWRRWSEGLDSDWTPASASTAEAKARDEQSAAFVGLPILSDRLIFLIDFSGSMWKVGDNGTTPKKVVEERLRECLETLPESTQFNLIPYTSEPIPWKSELQPATPRNVAAALKWFESRKDQGTGDFWEAFELALEDKNVDTLVVLGDGAPSGGTRFHFGLLPGLIHRATRDRGVAVDAILVGAWKSAKNAWGQTCESTRGRLVTTDL